MRVAAARVFRLPCDRTRVAMRLAGCAHGVGIEQGQPENAQSYFQAARWTAINAVVINGLQSTALRQINRLADIRIGRERQQLGFGTIGYRQAVDKLAQGFGRDAVFAAR